MFFPTEKPTNPNTKNNSSASDITRDTPTYASALSVNVATDHKIDRKAAG
jgi:hypothetical protein